MGDYLKNNICIEDCRVDVNAPLTQDEVTALYQLLEKFGRKCGSMSDQMTINTVRQWVADYSLEVIG